MQIFQVDAFTEKLFGGNPAAVCPLNRFIGDEIMQSIAAENNLAETAFFIPEGDGFRLRWFTPTIEVDLCGHATLATAHVLWSHLQYDPNTIKFYTKSGVLTVSKLSDVQYLMDFPSDPGQMIHDEEMISKVENGIGTRITSLYKGKDDYMAIIEYEKDILRMAPDFSIIASLPSRGLIVSAKGSTSDFVSRCFFPQSGIDEDPTTGSAHTLMTPYWSMTLKKNSLTAIQLSNRKGKLKCIYKGNRTAIIGSAITYMKGEVFI